MSTKTRDLSVKITQPAGRLDGNPWGGGSKVWKGFQRTDSSGHRKGRDGRYHEGGGFFSFRCVPSIPSVDVNLTAKGGTRTYSGPACVGNIPVDLGGFSVPSPDSKHLDPIGAEAISIIDPTNPNAQTGVALGEIIKDRRLPIPAIQAWKRRTEVAKAAGGEYLNAVFGWLPLVNDMKNTAQSVLDGNKIMENYQNASGTFVHREFAFDDIVETSESVVSKGTIPFYMGGANIGDFIAGNRVVTKSRKAVTKRWFSGSFTYLANSGGVSFGKCLGIGSEAEKLFGLSLTPDVIWELTPWSWAIDWFSNAGSVISNVNSFGLAGLVMRYGYIMEETSIVDTYSIAEGSFLNSRAVVPPATVTYTVKRRQEANPFGFGLKWDGLSPTQLAITAALGITRLR